MQPTQWLAFRISMPHFRPNKRETTGIVYRSSNDDAVVPQLLQNIRFHCGCAASVMSRSLQELARHALQMPNGPVGNCRADVAERKFHLRERFVDFRSRIKEKVGWLAALVFAAEEVKRA